MDRSRLLDIQGRGRKRQMELAVQYGITSYPAPAGGCLLTDPLFSRRLRDLFEHHPRHGIRDIELLKVGRHFRLGETTKAVVGRNAADNETIERLSEPGDALIRIGEFPGPTVLVPGGGDEETRRLAARICARYSDAPRDQDDRRNLPPEWRTDDRLRSWRCHRRRRRTGSSEVFEAATVWCSPADLRWGGVVAAGDPKRFSPD